MSTLPAQADLATFLAAARRIVAGADQMLAESFGKVTATQKADGSLVTATDRATDQYIAAQLKATFPDHAVLSEERNTQYDPAALFTWVVDPLDGTTNFVRGLPIWGVSMALLYSGEPVVGLLSFISLHEDYAATKGFGASFNSLPMHTANNRQADDQHFLMLCTRTPRRYRIDSPLKPRMLGSAAYHIASVASGSALAGIESTPKLWDVAAALLILSEAGGCYRSLDGHIRIFPLAPEKKDYERISFPLMIAANQEVLSELESSIVKY
jgi:myo-inositol-1(or 4)-monophosphatase